MKQRGKRQYFYRTLSIYTLICLIPMLVLSSFLYRQILRGHSLEVYERYQQTADVLSASLCDKLEEVYDLSTRLTLTPWVQRLRSNQDILHNTITHGRQGEIRNELTLYEMLIGISEQIGICLPLRNKVFTRDGLIYPAFFARRFPLSSSIADSEKLWSLISGTETFALVNLHSVGIASAEDGDLIILCPLDVLKHPRALLYCYISGASLEDMMIRTGLGDMLSVSVSAGGNDLFARQWEDGAVETIHLTQTRTVGTWEITCEMDFPGDVRPDGLAAFNALFTAIGLALLLSFMLSYPLALRTYKPISALVKKVGADAAMDRGGDELSLIEIQYDRLADERDLLARQMSQYEESIRGQLLTALLHGMFSDESFHGAQLRLSLRTDAVYQVMVFQDTTGAFGYACACMKLEMSGLKAEMVRGEENDWVLIFESKDAATLAALFTKEAEAADCFTGYPHPGILGISKSYYDVRQKANLRYFYPTDWEIQMINQMKLGNGKVVQRILSQLWEENERRAITLRAREELIQTIGETLLRVAAEFELDREALLDSLHHGAETTDWERLSRTVALLCDTIDASEEGESERLGAELLQYVNERYRDPDLSLTSLQEAFGSSQPVLSRAFKKVARLTYYDYLSRLRIEDAKKRLLVGGSTVGSIAKAVGYGNEATFQRAFKRYEGVSPTEYVKGASLH